MLYVWHFSGYCIFWGEKDPDGKYSKSCYRQCKRRTDTYLYEKGRLIKKIEPDEKATAYAYDTEGNVTETDRAGQKELSSYDAAGQLLSVSGAVSANTVYTYDKRGTGCGYVGTKGESCIKYFEWKIESKLIQFWLGYLKID